MHGKVCLVTGATSGIGKITAAELARLGATVIVVGRNPEKTEQVVSEIRAMAGHEHVTAEIADLSLMSEVRALADRINQRYERLDVLINNAGGIFNSRQLTSEGLEMTFALNHMGAFLLTNSLLDLIKLSAPARIITVSSDAHRSIGALDFGNLQGEVRYIGFSAYARSKLTNILFTYELARRLTGTGVTANALHPGAVATGFGMNNKGLINQIMFRAFHLIAISPEEGAQTPIYLASSPQVTTVSGEYFVKSRPVASSPASYDEDAQRRLWDLSEQIAGINLSIGARG